MKIWEHMLRGIEVYQAGQVSLRDLIKHLEE